jgi:hypothetical protein
MTLLQRTAKVRIRTEKLRTKNEKVFPNPRSQSEGKYNFNTGFGTLIRLLLPARTERYVRAGDAIRSSFYR